MHLLSASEGVGSSQKDILRTLPGRKDAFIVPFKDISPRIISRYGGRDLSIGQRGDRCSERYPADPSAAPKVHMKPYKGIDPRMFFIGDTVRYNDQSNKPYYGTVGTVKYISPSGLVGIVDQDNREWAAISPGYFDLVATAEPKPVMDAAAQEYEDAMAGAELLNRSD